MYAKMGVWERVPPALPFSFISHGWGGGGAVAAPTVCNMPQAENHPINWAEGRALHAANDCGETLYWRIGVAYLASEITSGLPVAIAGRLRV